MQLETYLMLADNTFTAMYFEFDRKYFIVVASVLVVIGSVSYFIAKDLYNKFERNFAETRQQTYYYDILDEFN